MLKKLCMTCLLFMFIFSAVGACALSPDSSEVYDGIDVSYWQGDIDFDGVRASGIEVVYIRACVGGDYIDPRFEQNYADAKASGLRVGFYHYITATTTAQARDEASFFVSLMSGKSPDCRPAMDFEQFGTLTPAEVNAVASAYLSELRELSGYLPILYSDAYNAQTLFDIALADYPLWVADYSVTTPPDNGKWRAWAGFQYSDSGSVSGIEGNVDLDKFTSTVFVAPYEPHTAPDITHTISYTVRPGDTLYALAIRYNTTVSVLAELNSIANPSLIYVGQVIKIPEDSSYTGTFYTIRPGDTLSALAIRFNTTVTKLVGINDIRNPNLIYVGETIIV